MIRRMNLNSRVIRGCRVSDCGNNGFGERKEPGAYMGVSKKKQHSPLAGCYGKD